MRKLLTILLIAFTSLAFRSGFSANVSSLGYCQATWASSAPGLPYASQTPSSTGNSYIDGLWRIADQWTVTTPTLAFSFPQSTTPYGPSYAISGPGAGYLAGWSAIGSTTQAALRVILAEYSSALNLQLVEITETAAGNVGTNHATIRYSYSTNTFATDAESYSPGTKSSGQNQYGDSWENTTCGGHCDFTNPVVGNRAYWELLHETGHTFGLQHPNASVAPTFPSDGLGSDYTVLAYQSYPGGAQFVNAAGSFPQYLQLDDIQALQAHYGARTTPATGPGVYTWSEITGEQKVNGLTQEWVAGFPQSAPTSPIIYTTIFNQCSSHVSFDTSNFSNNQTVDLRQSPGGGTVGWSTISTSMLPLLNGSTTANTPGNVAIAPGTIVYDATTGSGNDTIIGNSSNNVIDGGAGTNTFTMLDTFGNTTPSGPVGGYCILTSAADGTDQVKNIQTVVFSGAVTKSLNSSTCVLS